MTRHRSMRPALLLLSGALLVAPGALTGCNSRPKIDLSQAMDAERRLRLAVELNDRAAKHIEEGERAEAIALYADSIKLRDDVAATWNNLGVLLMEQREYVDAVEAFKRAADLAPTDPRPPTNAAIAYHRAGFDSDAMRYYEEALRRDERWLDALRGSAVSQMRLHRASLGAKRLVEQGLLVDPDPAWREVYERDLYRIERVLKTMAETEAASEQG
ncbi:MAG: tetratricopeptide repeat protein [Planctomycetota bacterium]